MSIKDEYLEGKYTDVKGFIYRCFKSTLYDETNKWVICIYNSNGRFCSSTEYFKDEAINQLFGFLKVE